MKKNIKALLLSIILVSYCVVSDGQNLSIESNQAIQNYDAIVIGAGMAGAKAASELAKAGKKVLILEVNDYIGGRMKTKSVPLLQGKSFNFELGANWIHGDNPNHPISQLAKQMGNIQTVQGFDSSVVVYDERRNDITQSVEGKLASYFAAAYSMKKFADRNISVYEGLRLTHPQMITDSEYMFNAGATQFFQAASIEIINANIEQGYKQINGPQSLVLSGYQRMPQYLANHTNIKVLLNHKVISVNRSGEVTIVKCQNGYTASSPNLIITVSVGVLKKKSIDFIPPLPDWKNISIEKIGFGNVVKILIVPKVPIHFPQQKQYVGIAMDNVSERGSAIYFMNIDYMTNLPALMTFGLGPNADRLEAMSQADMKVLVAKRLTLIMNSTIQTSDFDIQRTAWRSNPNFAGTYSFPGVQTNLTHWDDIARPIQDRNWFFAGEHTYSKYRGTVHAAFISGEIAAKKILKVKYDEPNN